MLYRSKNAPGLVPRNDHRDFLGNPIANHVPDSGSREIMKEENFIFSVCTTGLAQPSLVVLRPGRSRRWIRNRERRSAPAESQHSFPSSIGRQAPFSNIYPTVP